ncbi:phosphoenolpyruvate carboxylase [Algibacillus agarilyticus]|uniref:phosphoenolpyruvate carboxylase n=1 Tax=Algibacillus agarilyticus TaxID=2234133 RepID=UPI000DD0C0BC|nr:phosphoenolpyruvate carboxylase [Algibacillus agarilyticus]
MLEPIQQNVRDLGVLLGKTIAADQGEQWLDSIETVRLQGRDIALGDKDAIKALQDKFAGCTEQELLIYARAFSQFLNLVNVAEQQYTTSQQGLAELEVPHPLEALKDKIGQVSPAKFKQALDKLHIELVLTAHPTEVNRRTFIHKYNQIGQELDIHNDANSDRVAELVEQAWYTGEIRQQRPTPLDESRWGLNTVANSFWHAVPKFIKELDTLALELTGEVLPESYTPVTMASWMAGDRDGNPFVTAELSTQALINARLMACKLYLKDFEKLYLELSMTKATADLIDADESQVGPYRNQLKQVIDLLKVSIDQLQQGETKAVLDDSEQLRKPLQKCRQSLLNVGLKHVANSLVLDLIRKVNCFGISLVKLDIRQHSERHDSALSEITQALDMGDYLTWDEAERQTFLLAEINNPRPLLPKRSWSADTQEVLNTYAMIASQPAELFGLYIISMASEVSDVLAVNLLLKASGVNWNMPIAPLFETLDDLNNAPAVMSELLNIESYRGYCNDQHNVMIGYSDSAKDAGVLAATWGQYQCQEKLVEVFVEQNIELKLFHGRGGTIGRGGGPAHTAIASQPPGTLDGGLRVTEQGETIRHKFGTPNLATRSLHLYASAILECLVTPPPVPTTAWRELMETMSEQSCHTYRQYVQGNPDFVKYFRQATPEQELASLPLGSRPSKRKSDGGIESLRAIPWIFAWSQNRLVVPSWLGLGSALKTAYQDNAQLMKEMLKQWPYFYSRISLTEMVYVKSDSQVSALYDEALVSPELKSMGSDLRQQLSDDEETVLTLLDQKQSLEHNPWILSSFDLRRPYLAPLHILQIEALKRLRAQPEHPDNEQVLMVTMAGIATGMRNTG